MNGKWNILFVLAVSVKLYAANAPIQRIDVVNLLGVGGATPTSVAISFSNGVSTPCFSTTLPYLGALTVWVGVGQACTSAITAVTVIPTGANLVYSAPTNPNPINGAQYLTQIAISQNTAPVFDPNTGSLLTLGTTQVNAISNLLP